MTTGAARLSVADDILRKLRPEIFRFEKENRNNPYLSVTAEEELERVFEIFEEDTDIFVYNSFTETLFDIFLMHLSILKIASCNSTSNIYTKSPNITTLINQYFHRLKSKEHSAMFSALEDIMCINSKIPLTLEEDMTHPPEEGIENAMNLEKCLIFVMDTTASMANEIYTAKKIILDFVKNEEKIGTAGCYILVPFNDIGNNSVKSKFVIILYL